MIHVGSSEMMTAADVVWAIFVGIVVFGLLGLLYSHWRDYNG